MLGAFQNKSMIRTDGTVTLHLLIMPCGVVARRNIHAGRWQPVVEAFRQSGELALAFYTKVFMFVFYSKPG